MWVTYFFQAMDTVQTFRQAHCIKRQREADWRYHGNSFSRWVRDPTKQRISWKSKKINRNKKKDMLQAVQFENPVDLGCSSLPSPGRREKAGGGALVSCSTSSPINHIVFFLQNTSCIRKPQVISGGGGVCTPCTLPLDPPLYWSCRLKKKKKDIFSLPC